MTDKTELEICGAATPGERESEAVFDLIGNPLGYIVSPLRTTEGHAHFVDRADAEFHAHFNPQRVKELLTEIDRLKSENKALSDALNVAIKAKEDAERTASAAHQKTYAEGLREAAGHKTEIDRLQGQIEALKGTKRVLTDQRKELQELPKDGEQFSHEAAQAFWDTWKANGETGKHGFYESTWLSLWAALKAQAGET